MADEKISQLDAVASLDGTELVEVVKASDNERTTTGAIAALADVPQIAWCRSDEFGALVGDSPGVASISWNCANEGTFQVNFDEDPNYFAAAPCVTVTPLLGGGAPCIAHIVSVSATNVVIRITNDSGVQVQRGFHLHAFGEAP